MSLPDKTTELIGQLRARVAELTSRPTASIDTDASLAALGLESIMIIDLQALLEDEWALPDFPIAPTLTIKDIATRAERALTRDSPRAGTRLAAPGAAEASVEQPSLFPAAALQRAYLVGRRTDLPLGGVAAHMYLEFDKTGLDLGRAEAALRDLINRHDMLRTVLHPNGMFETLSSVPAYSIQVTDLRECSQDEKQAQLAQVRQQTAHRLRPADDWPPIEVTAALVEKDMTRLFVSLDFIVADAASCLSLLSEWGVLYAGKTLPPIPMTFAAWSRSEATVDPDRLERARAYWGDRVGQLPPAPELPLFADPAEVTGAHFERHQVHIDAQIWAALRERCAGRGLTTSVVLCAAYSRALAARTRRSDFSLTLTMFNRPPVAGIEHVVGDFSSTTLLAVEAGSRRTFGSLARSMQDRLWLDLNHRSMPGMAVLRELWRSRGTATPVPLMPVVFTSLFEDFSGLKWLGENVYGVSETPQVYLDHQSFERDGKLVLQFDYVPALVAPKLVEALAEDESHLLRTLARDALAWDSIEELTSA